MASNTIFDYVDRIKPGTAAEWVSWPEAEKHLGYATASPKKGPFYNMSIQPLLHLNFVYCTCLEMMLSETYKRTL